MTTSKTTRHLNPEQLIEAVVDESTLPATERRHWQSCPQCQDEIESLSRDLNQIGDLAHNLSPTPRRPIRASDLMSKPVPWWQGIGSAGRWVPAAATAMVVAALWIGVYFPILRPSPAPLEPPRFTEDELMHDVYRLTQSALPWAYQSIALQDHVPLDEDFFEFAIPLQDQTMSQNGWGKENHPC